MIAQVVLLALLVAGLVLLLLVLAVLAIVEWSARVRRPGERGADAERTPAESAEVLLRDLLDEREYRQLKQRGYVDVASPNDPQRIYRIPSYAGLVRVYEGGWAVRELCLQSVEPLPNGDVVVMHKLLIQGNEPEYLARARQYARAGPQLRYHAGGGGASTPA